MTLVVIVVFDRMQNIQEWVRCWSMCETQNAKLLIINNVENETSKSAYQSYCSQVGVAYLPHDNVGYDIARLQDAVLGRLEGFPTDFDNIIWVTDDTLPMRKDFIHTFTNALSDEVVVSCMELPPTQNNHSVRAKMHIRTTGFCMSKEWFYKLKFTKDPIVTKFDCYEFEHMGDKTFLDQVQSWGKKAIQVTDINVSPLWDMGRPRQAKRKAEHYKLFPLPKQSDKKIAFVCLIYNSYPLILGTLLNQTHQNWNLILVHDGPNSTGLKELIEFHNDKRITYIERPVRLQNWGHAQRQWALQEMKAGRLANDCDYVLVGNADNWYSPVFCERMITEIEKHPNAVAAYTQQMLHSYLDWGIINCKMVQGYIDAGNVMIKRECAVSVGWNYVNEHSADFLYFKDVMNKYGSKNFIPVKGVHFSHN